MFTYTQYTANRYPISIERLFIFTDNIIVSKMTYQNAFICNNTKSISFIVCALKNILKKD